MAITKRTSSDYTILTPGPNIITLDTGEVLITNTASILGNVFTEGIFFSNAAVDSISANTGALITTGGVGIGGNLYVGQDTVILGNLNVTGTQTIINTNNTSLSDSVIYLADNNPSDIVDIGIISSFTNPGYQHTGFVRDASDGVWKIFANVTAEPTTTVDFTFATYSPLQVGSLHSTLTTSANSAITGAITTAGGAGIAGNLYVGQNSVITGEMLISGNVIVNATTNSSSISTGALTVAGGIGIVGNIYAGGRLNVNSDNSLIAINNGGTTGVGNIGASGQIFNTVFANSFNGTLVTAAQPNITSVGTLISLNVTGNVVAGNVSGTNLTGTLATPAQPNVTSVGTLTSLSINGNVSISNGGKVTYDQTSVNIPTSGTLHIIDSFVATTYSSAKYIIQTKNGGNIESAEALLITDGANAYVTTYGVVNSGTALGTISANVNGGNATLYYTSTSLTNSNVKVFSTYIV